LRLVLLALLAYLLYRVLRSFFGPSQKIMKSDTDGVIDEMVQDPICKTYIPLRDAQRRVIDGREQYFCSVQCADRFEKQRGH
jgi:YHS domain-containing protein